MGTSFEQWLDELKADMEHRRTEALALLEANRDHYPLAEQLRAIGDHLGSCEACITYLEVMIRGVRDMTNGGAAG